MKLLASSGRKTWALPLCYVRLDYPAGALRLGQECERFAQTGSGLTWLSDFRDGSCRQAAGQWTSKARGRSHLFHSG